MPKGSKERTITVSVRITPEQRDGLQAIATAIGYGATMAGVLQQMIVDAIKAQKTNPTHTRRVWELEP